jgi:hypothetical protein
MISSRSAADTKPIHRQHRIPHLYQRQRCVHIHGNMIVIYGTLLYYIPLHIATALSRGSVRLSQK